MTSRSTTLMFIALVLLATMAVAATPAPNDAPATVALTTSAAPPVEASSSCNPLLAKLGISPLDSAQDAAINPPSTYPACGSCSELPCRGLSIYDFCGGTIRQPKRCKTAGLVCIETPDNPKCICVDWATP